MIPEDGVSVEVSGGIEPQIDTLFSVALSVSVDVCLNCVWLSTAVSQELEIQLVPNRVSVGVHLPQKTKMNGMTY